jgi:hypothetical protein
MEGMPIMQVRRRWAPVAEMPASDRAGALTSRQQPGATTGGRQDVRNPRYVSPSALLDADRTTPRFVPRASIEGWRERIRRDATMRAVLLNPVDYEPRES